MIGALLDLRYTLRGLRKSPGLLIIALVTIALGVGANTAMFSVVNAVLLRPLPYADSDELVSLWPEKRWSIQMLNDVRERVSSYEATTAYGGGILTLFGGAEPEPLDVSAVTPEYLGVLGVAPMLGRDFTADDAAAASGYVAILTHGAWQSLFGGDPTVVGRTVDLAGMGATQRTIIGVMPDEFRGMNADAQVIVPLITTQGVPGFAGQYGFSVLGRLRDGVSDTRARAELRALVDEFTPLHPTQFREIRYSPVDVVPLLERIVSGVRSKLMVLLGVVGFILLIACTNVANLLLARSAARQRDVAVQVALGSGRGRITRQVLLESLVLSLAGGAIGVATAYAALPLIRRYVQEQLPRTGEIGMDYRVLLFAILISTAAGILFGAFPALRAMRLTPTGMLRESSRAQSAGRGSGRVNDALVTAEIALSLILLAGAGLMLKSLVRLSSLDPGFRVENVLTMQLSLPPGKYSTEEEFEAFARQALTRVQEIPGVVAVGSINMLPLSNQSSGIPYQVEGQPVPEGEGYQVVNIRLITPGYFETLQIPVKQGRIPEAGEADVLLVNEAFARHHWPGEDPLGRRLLNTSGEVLGAVVGVVGDVRQMAIAEAPVPEVYLHTSVDGWQLGTLVVRFDRAVPAASAVSGPLRDIEPRLVIRNAREMSVLVDEALGDARFFTRLFAAFAALAVLLGLIGVYGVMSFAMSRRFRELGIRMALGATAQEVVRGALVRALVPIGAGVALGVVGALLGGRLLASMLYEVNATDPWVLLAVAALMTVCAAGGALIPAIRAVRLNPVAALRVE